MEAGFKDIYIFKIYERVLSFNYKSVKFGTGWGEHCRIIVDADGMLNKESVMAASTRVFNKAKNLVKLDILKEKENIKKILGVNDQQFDEMVVE